MKKLVLFLLSILYLTYSSWAQEGDFVEISTGASYANTQFYNIVTDETVSIPLDSWDLVFSNFGLQDAGVLINEGSPLGGTGLTLYHVPNALWSDTIATDTSAIDSLKWLLNPDENWIHGAFNLNRDSSNAFDYGWGIYNPQTRIVEGNQIFLIEKRDGQFIKISLDSLFIDTYYFKTANPDGSNEQSYSVSKSDSDDQIIFFSLASGEAIDVGINYHLIYTRYNERVFSIFDPSVYQDYVVTGILSAPTAIIAEAGGVDVVSINPDSTNLEFSDKSIAIGSDWKSFSFTTGWSITDSLVFFIKVVNDESVYKIVFVDFEGSSTGTGTFQKSFFDITSSIATVTAQEAGISIYPNPFVQSISIDGEFNSVAQVQLFDMNGRLVVQDQVRSNDRLEVGHLPSGGYILLATIDGKLVTHKLVK